MSITEESLKADIELVARIPFLASMLDVVCLATGMGFAAVARVTEERWIAGAVRDEIKFGMVKGGELPVATTICHEIRQSHLPVIIDHVSHDTHFCDHHTPAKYGFESYISFPIIRKNGSFFGTLCAIDPHAAILNTPSMVGIFSVFSELIAEYLDGVRGMPSDKRIKLEMYIAAELRNTRIDMESDNPVLNAEKSERKMAQLSMKGNMLLMAIDPSGAMLR